ncbi:RnfABCDGE type electron transport complex subunit D [Thermodesulfobacteriota bacterium]
MLNQKLLISSHAPFCHNGTSIRGRSINIMIAAIPAVIMGIVRFGFPALAVVAFSMTWAMIWELLMNKVMKRPVSIGDGNAAVIGLMFAMLMPATTPWWAIVTGTFIAVVVGKQIFGGIGCNPLNPALVGIAIIMMSWKGLVNFDEALVNYNFEFYHLYPLGAIKQLGAPMADAYIIKDLLLGLQTGGTGAIFGLGLIIGGIYLILTGTIRWQISVSFLAGIFITALIFNLSNPEKYAEPLFHILTGYTLIGAFFLITEDASSPVNSFAMILYGLLAGILTVLIRNIGTYVDGTVLAILMMNITSPLLDRIRPRALGKGVDYA